MHATKALLTAAQILQLNEKEHIHQHNNNAIRLTRSLSEPTGIKSIGVHLVRVQQGRDSTEFHSHQQDEEFIYILSGQGIASIGEDQFSSTGIRLHAAVDFTGKSRCQYAGRKRHHANADEGNQPGE